MVETGDVLPNDTESVTELELKNALRNIILYMGELNTDSIHNSVVVPGSNCDFRVDLSIAIEDVQETNHE